MVAFVAWELRTREPLLRLQIFRDRGFAVETIALGLMSVVFVPFFFFASVYAQVSLGESASNAGLYILYFFLGFVIMAQIGGRILDRRGARPAVVVRQRARRGRLLPARRASSPTCRWARSGSTSMLAGGGIGLMLAPASTDAVNRAPEHQLQRGHRHHPDRAQLRREPRARRARRDPDQPQRHQRHRRSDEGRRAERRRAQGRRIVRRRRAPAPDRGQPHALVHDVQLAFAHSTQTVFYIMAAVMAATCLLSLRRLPGGRVEPNSDVHVSRGV